MRRLAVGSIIIGAAVALSGCVSDSTVDLIAADPEFTPKAQIGAAPMSTFQVGDIFRYKVGYTLVAESVERIDSDGVWWRDNLGRRWVGSDGALVPSRAIARSNGKAQIVDAKVQSPGDMFPITVGKTVAFRTSSPNWLNGTTTQDRSCTVEEFGTLKIVAGHFDTFRVKCLYDGHVRYNYYAPVIGRVVLQTTDTVLDSVQRELLAFERGTGEPIRTASGPAADKMKMAPTARAKPARLTTGAAPRFGIQLAAYRSQNRVKKAWSWIKRRGGPFLANLKPHYERAENAGGPLYRLIVGDFTTKAEARRHCQALKRNGFDCWLRPHVGAPGPVAAATPADGFRLVSR